MDGNLWDKVSAARALFQILGYPLDKANINTEVDPKIGAYLAFYRPRVRLHQALGYRSQGVRCSMQ